MPLPRPIDHLLEIETEDSENVAPIRDASASSHRSQPQGMVRPIPLSENSPVPILPTAVVPASKTKLKVTIKNWTGVATWFVKNIFKFFVSSFWVLFTQAKNYNFIMAHCIFAADCN